MNFITCTRCGGTGEYSYNPTDGKRCFKCKGAGKVEQKGKAIKPTASSFNVASVGDIVKQYGVLCRVDRIIWQDSQYGNQTLFYTQLTDNVQYKTAREAYNNIPEGMNGKDI